MNELFRQYRPALIFIAKFVGLYLVLNTLYGGYIQSYTDIADPITLSVTRMVAGLLSWLSDPVSALPLPGSVYVALQDEHGKGVNVFEGCNGVNVMIVYVSFLFTFTGQRSRLLYFFLGGLGTIALANMIRVSILFQVAVHFPEQLYFFHKYLFTGIIYAIVFLLWFFWVRGANPITREA